MLKRTGIQRARLRMTFVAMMVLAVSLLSFPQLARGNHTEPVPEELEGAVCGFVADLDVLLSEFDDQIGPFEDERLNRALQKARAQVEEAQAYARVPELTKSFQNLKGAMGELEKGAAVPVSGSGFADDLASLGSFFAEVFVEDLIEVASNQGAVEPETLATATTWFEAGVLERDEGEWEKSITYFLHAIRILEHELNINSPQCE